jgi:hypothetical protein
MPIYPVKFAVNADGSLTGSVEIEDQVPVPPVPSLPIPIAGSGMKLAKDWSFGTDKGTIKTREQLLKEFFDHLWWYGSTIPQNLELTADSLILWLTKQSGITHASTIASKWTETTGTVFIEVLARCEAAQGSWPGIWLYPNMPDIQSGSNGGEAQTNEIDIMEKFDNGGQAPNGGSDPFYGPNRAKATVLWGNHQTRWQQVVPVDTTQWHKYAVLKKGNSLEFFYDDKSIGKTGMSWTDAPPMLVLDHWCLAKDDQGGGAIGGPGLADGKRVAFEVAYARAYQ